MTGPIVLLACVAACLGVAVSPLPSNEMMDPHGPRARAMRRAEQRLAASVMVLAACSMLSLFAMSLGTTRPIAPLCGIVLGTILFIHPWIVVRWLLIPLGLPRAAYAVSRLGGHPWIRDPHGGAVLAGVLALVRGRPRPHVARWLWSRLVDEGPVGGAGIVAAGLLAADAGDRERARMLLASIELLDNDVRPPYARQVAVDWLVADAAARGAWIEVVERVGDEPSPSPTTRLLGVAARRLLGEPLPRKVVLLAWLRAPRRLTTLGLAIRALRGPELALVVDDAPGMPAANDGGEPILTALALHREASALGESEPVARAAVERLAGAWDRVFADFGFRGQVRARAEALSCWSSAELLVARLQRSVCRDLASLLSRCGREADDVRMSAGVLRRTGELHLEWASERLEEECVAVARRRTAAGAVLDEWAAIAALRARYCALASVGGLATRRPLYERLERDLRLSAAWLWNGPHERALAHALWGWLLAEAERVADEESAAYHRHNVAVGL